MIMESSNYSGHRLLLLQKRGTFRQVSPRTVRAIGVIDAINVIDITLETLTRSYREFAAKAPSFDNSR